MMCDLNHVVIIYIEGQGLKITFITIQKDKTRIVQVCTLNTFLDQGIT